MKFQEQRLAALVVSLSWLVAAAHAESTVSLSQLNGNFESLQPTDTMTYLGNGGTYLPVGWNLSPTNQDSQSNFSIDPGNTSPYTLPQNPSNYAAFMATSTDADDWDCLFVDLATTAGVSYNVSFYVALTSVSVSNTQLLAVWDNGFNSATNSLGSRVCMLPNAATGFTDNACGSYDFSGGSGFNYADPTTGTAPVGYEKFSFTETATQSDTQLIFHGRDSNGAILLDNVTVAQVSSAPEASSVFLAGSGLVLVCLFRRFRN